MEKRAASELFANDGSFMERFKQLQQEKEKGSSLEESKPGTTLTKVAVSNALIGKSDLETKASDLRRSAKASPSGKFAFSLKQKSKLVTPPVNLGEDEEEDEKDGTHAFGEILAKRQKLVQLDATEHLSKQPDVAPPPPSDPTMKNAAEKLASFVAKNGRRFEHITRQKNPGDTPFKFLFDETCADYKYYEYRRNEEERFLMQSADVPTLQSGGPRSTIIDSKSDARKSNQMRSNYQIPAAALYDVSESTEASATSAHTTATEQYEESSAPTAADPIAMMEFYVKKAAQEEKRRQPKHSKDEMPPPASLQGPANKGHHMGDYIPPEELEKFMANCDDAVAQKAAKASAEKAKITADNVGHKLLSKMGWKEGEGLGSSRSGIADPIMAGNVKLNNLGVGAAEPGEVTPEDDIYEQYKKRMMLGYRYRPNPMNNPRKSYY